MTEPDQPASPKAKRTRSPKAASAKPQSTEGSTKPKPKPARKGKEPTPEGPISIRWELAELPSSQHKAGLAGLALCVRFLNRNPAAKGVCEVAALDASGLTLRVDSDGMQALFDELYAASLEEQEREAPLKDREKQIIEPKRTVDRVLTTKGKEKTKTFYIYDAVVPLGDIVASWDKPPSGERQLWLKLWRDFLWTVVRGVPATREPYDLRANGTPPKDGCSMWLDLATAPASGVDLPSTYYLGAQAKTAEMASFRDVARYQFLLHFWPVVVPLYRPESIDRDGKREFTGYAVAVPEIVDLEGFVSGWSTLMQERSTAVSGYIPRDAVIDLAGEAGLDVARRILSVIRRQEGQHATAQWVSGVEVYHVEKEGNNVRLRSLQRVDLRRDRADAYGRCKDAYWSTVFRRQRIANLLEDRPWWSGFGRLCAQTPKELTVEDTKFRHDCRVAMTEVEMKETTDDEPKTLEQLVYQAVRTYVLGRLSSKYGLKWSDVGANPALKSDYEDKKSKLAREAFLAVRSRTGDDFVSYFTATLCAVPQRLGEHGYLELARALANESEVERIRSLTLLALSANG